MKTSDSQSRKLFTARSLTMLRAYAQLLRLPNVFTAMADVCLGWLIIHGNEDRKTSPELLFYFLGISACLYSSGMVLNDYFDVEEDRRDRPFRPIPSGRISRRKAGILGFLLMFVGLILALFAWNDVGHPRPAIVAGLLSVCILLYNSWLKRTAIGPLMMGLCRFFNVLLGLSGDYYWWIDAEESGAYLVAPIIGFYIIGVTRFAKTETIRSRQYPLIVGAAFMLIAFALAMTVPTLFWPTAMKQFVLPSYVYPVFPVSWAIIVGIPVGLAIRNPDPRYVQRAVKTCILGLIGLDAVLAFGIVGWPGLLILCLLPPALILGRWVYST